MRLAFKLMLVVVSLVMVALIAEAWFHIRHEAALHQADLHHELRSRSTLMQAALEGLGPLDGAAATEFIATARARLDEETLWLIPEASLATTEGLSQVLREGGQRALESGREVVLAVEQSDDGGLYHFFPLSESPSDGHSPRRFLIIQRAPRLPWIDVVEQNIERFTLQIGLMVFFAAIAMIIAGRMLVARPVEALIQRARRISQGRFSGGSTRLPRGVFHDLDVALIEMAATLESAQRTAEKETLERIDALEQLRHGDRLRTVGTLAAGIAHDLGTPLQIVLGYAARLARREDAATTAAAHAIEEQALRMDHIVRQLMRFAAPSRQARSTQDLRGLVEDACALVAPLDRKIGVRVVNEGAEAIPVHVDPEHVEQVVVNLVANAILASREGDDVVISIDEVEEDGQAFARVCVRDEGEGMPPGVLEQAFDPFFTTRGVGRGTGLGLAIVHGIVKEYEGKVRVESLPGQGSFFEILFPRSDA